MLGLLMESIHRKCRGFLITFRNEEFLPRFQIYTLPDALPNRRALTSCVELYFVHEFRCRDRTGHCQTPCRGVCGIGALVRR